MTTLPRSVTVDVIAGIVFALLLGFGGYEFYAHKVASDALNFASTTLSTLETERATLTQNLQETNDALEAERQKNTAFQNQLDELSGTVGKLDKLANTDPQLLAKYSKVYFLNENYTPVKLTQIPQSYISNSEDEYLQSQVWPFLKDLLNDAHDDGINLTIVSGYRSFDKQKALKSTYKVTYGTGANAFSADQGYSEHQLGSAVDFSTKETNGALDGFDKTKAYQWLLTHAHRYGFTLSYPVTNAFYSFEPWHWRFVGRELADDLYDRKQHFYDLDQRDINEYLISLFDN